MRVSRGFVLALTAVGAVLVLGALSAPHLLFRMQSQSAVIGSLSYENERLRTERESFETALTEVSRRLDEYESHAGHLASALGVEDLRSSRPAAGGPGSGPPAAGRFALGGELEALRGRGSYLGESLEQLDQAFQERINLLTSTPSVMPVQGWFSHGFGWRKDPFTEARQFHRGIDIVADHGTSIVAPANGVVSRATRLSDYGKTLDLSHGHGYVTRYGHMSEVLVRPGQQVRRGEVIGRVGSTGRSTGPHLHYEVFRDGRRVNPWRYLGQKGR
jgi:murein DD-endopeptidase MepM/ murein hydrolase activator NlpD